MRCQNCTEDNSESNRFCGHCGVLLQKPQPEATSRPVLNSFREDVAQQQSELRSIQQGQETVGPMSESTTPPLSKIATASADFGPSEPVAAPPPRERTPEWFSPARGGHKTEPSITGPSFLGLSDPDGRDEADLSYLYEDDYQRPNRARQSLIALIILGVIGFGLYEWRYNPAFFANLNDWARHSINYVRGTPESPTTAASARPDTAPVNPAPLPGAAPTANQAADINSPESAKPSVAQSSNAQSAPQPRPEPRSQTEPPASKVTEEEEPQAEPAALPKAPAAMAAPTASRRKAPGSDLVSKADEYLYGRGVPKNCDQALVYLRAAADHGNSSASSKLGGLYATGNCVTLDRAQAYNWFSRALASGEHNLWIERNMTMLWNQMTPEEKSRVRR